MGAEWRPSPLQRRQCRHCGSHTFSDLCGCCYGEDLVPVDAHPMDRAGGESPVERWLAPRRTPAPTQEGI